MLQFAAIIAVFALALFFRPTLFLAALLVIALVYFFQPSLLAGCVGAKVFNTMSWVAVAWAVVILIFFGVAVARVRKTVGGMTPEAVGAYARSVMSATMGA
jgi:hypothetical protein